MNRQQMHDLLDKVGDIVGEQCVGFAIALSVEDEAGDSVTLTSYAGGETLALGLANVSRLRLEKRILEATGSIDRDQDEDDAT